MKVANPKPKLPLWNMKGQIREIGLPNKNFKQNFRNFRVNEKQPSTLKMNLY